MLETHLNFLGNALVFLADVRFLLVVVLDQRIQVLLVANFLLLFSHFQGANVLFQFALGDSVLVLNVFKCNLGVFLELGKLILVLEDQMLQALLVDFDLDFVLLVEVLELTFFVTQLGLLVLEFLLTHQPKVVDS